MRLYSSASEKSPEGPGKSANRRNRSSVAKERGNSIEGTTDQRRPCNQCQFNCQLINFPFPPISLPQEPQTPPEWVSALHSQSVCHPGGSVACFQLRTTIRAENRLKNHYHVLCHLQETRAPPQRRTCRRSVGRRESESQTDGPGTGRRREDFCRLRTSPSGHKLATPATSDFLNRSLDEDLFQDWD